MRSHARRNRERILEVARGAFAGSDRDISLNEVARQAEVGIGTLFRHFPNRDALLEALPHDRTAALLDEVDRLLDAPDAGAALFGWLDKLIAHIATYRGGWPPGCSPWCATRRRGCTRPATPSSRRRWHSSSGPSGPATSGRTCGSRR
ncbi:MULTISPECIES: TetR/AcrR family transcriptional regulator [unclassified Frankia]|uniref:TetR/AcrR family transcriptional regulator n=1 Tax=unclassified Frankia TaxID=2632575 RepID=UPI001F0D6AE8|nr:MULTISPECIES: TetR/AcrR family transcriptional regulator [unclassified Frankia]